MKMVSIRGEILIKERQLKLINSVYNNPTLSYSNSLKIVIIDFLESNNTARQLIVLILQVLVSISKHFHK